MIRLHSFRFLLLLLLTTSTAWGKPLVVSGHRGGRIAGYGENSIEMFDYMFRKGNIRLFEIDPRMTRDSLIVLMHDATLNRTTTATGSLSALSYEQTRTLFLKDYYGGVTTQRIPLLEDVIRWAVRNKVTVNLDHKDVPIEKTAELLRRMQFPKYVMLTVHKAEQAAYYLKQNPAQRFSVFARTPQEFEPYEEAGLQIRNSIAYIGATMKPEYKEFYARLRKKGYQLMISVCPTHDRCTDPKARETFYRKEIEKKPDVIESDYPLEVAAAVKLR